MRLSLSLRITLILLAGLLAAQFSSVWLQSDERASVVLQARGLHFADRLAETIRQLEAAEPARRAAVLAALQTADLHAEFIAENQVSPNVPRGQMQSNIGARLGHEHEIRSAGGQGGMQQREGPLRRFDVRLNDGQWVRITGTREPAVPGLSSDLIVQLLLAGAIVIAVVLFAVNQATRPLKQLANAADAFGRDLDAPPISEEGPTETVRAAGAFNRMQGRIKRLVEERSRALAAVSHDLRTPLTRLRLRCELVDDNTLREQMNADLEAMAMMLDNTLNYLRDLQDSEPLCRIDIDALLSSLAEDASIEGRSISVDGRAGSPYQGRLSALRRALQNLIDNAVKYGHTASLRVEDDTETLRITVDDSGPGIPPDKLANVLEPYYRLDSSRNQHTGGVGLGLSIARDIALKHGGELQLVNRPGGGLSATLVLPRGTAPN